MKRTLFAALLMASLTVMSQTVSAGVTDADLANDQATPGDIVTNGLGRDAQRYSPLDKINRDIVKKLLPAWSISFGGEKQRSQDSQPIICDGIMCVTGFYSRMWAIDVKSGKELWQYDARLPDGILVTQSAEYPTA